MIVAARRTTWDGRRYTVRMPECPSLLVLLVVAVLVAIGLLVAAVAAQARARAGSRRLRDEQRDGRGELRQQLDSLSSAQVQRIDGFGARLTDFSTRTDQRLDVLREALTEDARKARSEVAEQQQRFADGLGQRLNELTQRNEQRIGEMRATLETQLQKLQADNAAQARADARRRSTRSCRARWTRGSTPRSSWSPSGSSRCSAGWARCSSWPPASATSSAC